MHDLETLEDAVQVNKIKVTSSSFQLDFCQVGSSANGIPDDLAKEKVDRKFSFERTYFVVVFVLCSCFSLDSISIVSFVIKIRQALTLNY